LHHSQETFCKPKIPRCVGICKQRNAWDSLADDCIWIPANRFQSITELDRTWNLFGEEQKDEQSYNMWHVSLYTLGEKAKVDALRGRDWILFLLISNVKDPVLKQKIVDLDKADMNLACDLAVPRKHKNGLKQCQKGN
jgi:hypothetical protein